MDLNHRYTQTHSTLLIETICFTFLIKNTKDLDDRSDRAP